MVEVPKLSGSASGPPEPTDQHELADSGNDLDAEWKGLDLRLSPLEGIEGGADVDLEKHEDDQK